MKQTERPMLCPKETGETLLASWNSDPSGVVKEDRQVIGSPEARNHLFLVAITVALPGTMRIPFC
jgi:hypothetical protein